MHQLGVEDGGAGCAANRIVSERHELVVEERTRPEASDGHGHAAVTVHVEQRLRTVDLGEIYDRPRWRGRQAEILRAALERPPGIDHGFGRGLLFEPDRHRRGVTVLYRH